MILSASRRTDIPALYGKWFVNRMKEGFLMVRNPMNPNQTTKVILTSENIDFIVFWTKNPQPVIPLLDELQDYKYYFHVTINPYDTSIEKNVPQKNMIIKAFTERSEILGRELKIEKDRNQRKYCGCIKSTDAGAYNTCIEN
jgi:hypothetical protein